jgi:ATP-binding cassette subfamily B protein
MGVTVGTIAEFIMYVNMLTFPVSAIGWTASMIQRASASQKRINAFMDVEPSICDPVLPVRNQLDGKIRFQNVSYTYPNTGIRALRSFSLTIEKGQRIAIVGQTGSGKTTIAQLLLRMMDPDEGEIIMDDTPLNRYALSTLRTQICYVPQDVFLFSDSIRENIAFGVKEANDKAVFSAADQACVYNDINGFPDKFATQIGERGVTLSGGQKQRVSIARALIKDKGILLFDDCLSAVDTKTENDILLRLNDHLTGRTALFITHRINPSISFDKIIVLVDGEIAEMGTHEELLQHKGYYFEMFEQQRIETDFQP